MSLDPHTLLEKLEASAKNDPTVYRVLFPGEADWILHQLKHKDDQIAALTKLVKPARAFETICQEADRITSGDRQAAYGSPSDDFSRTAAMWEPILGLPPGAISPETVAYCMIAVKLSRLCHGYKRDSVVDIAGYAKCASEICGARV